MYPGYTLSSGKYRLKFKFPFTGNFDTGLGSKLLNESQNETSINLKLQLINFTGYSMHRIIKTKYDFYQLCIQMWGKGKRCRLRAFARENSKYENIQKRSGKMRESTLGYYKKWKSGP